ncbi:MAG TPA: GtrA family protein [Stellaceae bacterium]|nr:GtrA family protein [Stellaceae bacterium]
MRSKLIKYAPLLRQVGSFGLIGTLGFLIDASLLLGLTGLGANAYAARACSFLCAASAAWYLNRRFTFRHGASDAVGVEWLRYLAVNLVGAILNLGTYAVLLSLVPTRGPLLSILGVAAGSIAGMCSNFTLARVIVFKMAAARPEAS